MAAASMQLGPLSPDQARRFAPMIPSLIRATGSVSYDYQFGREGLLERLVAASWPTPDTLFCADCVTAATANGDLLGIELGFAGPNFANFKANLALLAPGLVERGEVSYDALIGLTVRARKASYLNTAIPDDVYYLHALSTLPQHRSQGVGKALLLAAIDRARAANYRELQLDVLADNPAASFYRAMGLEVICEVRSPELSREHGFPSEYRMAVAL